MADVIGILGFALHAAHKVYTIIESIKDAPGEIQALRDDALQVHGFLEKLLGSQDGSSEGQSGPSGMGNVQDSQIDALVRKARALTDTVDTFFNKTTTKKDDGTYVVKKLRWPLYTGEAKKLSEQFKSFHLSLTAVYTVLTSYVPLLPITVTSLPNLWQHERRRYPGNTCSRRSRAQHGAHIGGSP